MKNTSFYTLLIGVTTVVVASVIYLVVQASHDDAHLRISDQERAVRAAELYEPSDECELKETFAEHENTGATYSFESECLPRGWTANSVDDEPVSDRNDDTNSGSSPSGGTGSSNQEEPSSTSPDDFSTEESAREIALREARAYQPRGACTTVMTPAKHTETGATYTFPSGCIPDGWTRTSHGTDR